MWDLRAYLRENLLAWVRDNAPWAIPASRRIVEGPEAVADAWATEALLPEHLSEPLFTGPTGGGYMRAEQQKRIAADLRADQERKDAKDPLDALKDAQNPSSLPGVSPVQPSTLSDLVQAAASEPLPAAPDIQRIEDRLPGRADPYDRPVPDAFKDLKPGHMLFSGSPEAEERAKIYRGPGENVIRDREDRAQVRLEESNEPLPPEVAALRPRPSRP